MGSRYFSTRSFAKLAGPQSLLRKQVFQAARSGDGSEASIHVDEIPTRFFPLTGGRARISPTTRRAQAVSPLLAAKSRRNARIGVQTPAQRTPSPAMRQEDLRPSQDP